MKNSVGAKSSRQGVVVHSYAVQTARKNRHLQWTWLAESALSSSDILTDRMMIEG